MSVSNPAALLNRLLEESFENEWLEFKLDNSDPDRIGRTVCACANAAMLAERDRAYLIWGIENGSKRKQGTTVRLKELTKGSEKLENWLSHLVEPKLMMEFLDFQEGDKSFAILAVEPTYDRELYI